MIEATVILFSHNELHVLSLFTAKPTAGALCVDWAVIHYMKERNYFVLYQRVYGNAAPQVHFISFEMLFRMCLLLLSLLCILTM